MDTKVDYELPTALLKSRLEAMNAKSPFKIEYNQSLENVIKSFLKYRKHSFERLMAISDIISPCLKRLSPKKMYHWR
jgi:membrane-bound lytic murein transglycosylase D